MKKKRPSEKATQQNIASQTEIKTPIRKTFKQYVYMLRMPFWFLSGSVLGFFFLMSFLIFYYERSHATVIYPSVLVNNIDLSNKTPQQVQALFAEKNKPLQRTTFTFVYEDKLATISAQELHLGYDDTLIAKQAYSVGRSSNFISNLTILLQAYTNGITIPATIRYDDTKLDSILDPVKTAITVKPVDAKFTFQNNKVVEFRQSSDGREVDMEALKKTLHAQALAVIKNQTGGQVRIAIPVRTIKPAITTDKVNNMGITELVGTGTSLFAGSIENRIYNIGLAASRLNGVLIPPDTVFSFDKALGDVSSLTGYKQAYVIENGKTVLGDGGGVCQVSTTFFRAILAAGYPITERNAHAYRVHYYEEDSPPGIDAAIYWPTVDLKFKNDSGHYLLVQTVFDPQQERLTFNLYGTKDNREVSMSTPIITSQTPAPTPLYQDDPTLPKGQVKQVDFSADGASVYFTRTVKKDGKVIIADKFISNYRPWQAIYLRGTK